MTSNFKDLLLNSQNKISRLSKINIILGKNGCGKSTLLRDIENTLFTRKEAYGKVKYIMPERGGHLSYEAIIDSAINGNQEHYRKITAINHIGDFKRCTVTQLRKLREDQALDKINLLLDNIELRSVDIKHDEDLRKINNLFKVFKKGTETEIKIENISSGESEIITLAIESLIFEKECEENKENFFLLNEPDLHLHPDIGLKFEYK